MRKLKLLMAAFALFGAMTASAQVYIETDLTDQFNSLATTQWTGSSGQVGWAAPQVTTNSGLKVAAWERYNGSCDWTGDIMYTTVTGLVAGTYKIELYGAAAFTFGRGFGSTAFTGSFSKDTSDTYTENQSITENTGVTLYATTSEGTVSDEIPIYYATNFNASGIATATLNNVVVGSDGQIKIGLSKTSTSTNWHVVQLKGVTATVDAEATFATFKAQAEALYSRPMNATVLSDLQAAANVNLSSAGADEYKTAIETLQAKIPAAKTSIANYEEAKAILDAANSYDAAGQANYAADEAIAAIQTAYNEGSLTAVTAEQKAAAKAALTTACKAQTQPADGCDMTAYIVNPGIDGNANGWTTEKKGNTGGTGGPMKPSNDAMEYWGASTIKDGDSEKGFDYYQTITDLPDGAYTIGADLLNSTNGEEGANWNGGGNAGVYGKTASAEVIKVVTEDGETFKPYTTDEILVVDGTLRLGVKNIHSLTGRWFACDNFKLTYARQLTAEEVEAIAKANAIEAYNAALAAATAIAAGTIPTAAYTTLSGVISNNTLTDGTSAEYIDATNALNVATAAAQPLVAPYATWLTLKTNAEGVATGHEKITEAIGKVTVYVETLTAVEKLTEVNTMTAAMIKNYSAWDVLKKNADALVATSTTDVDARTVLATVRDTQAANISNAATETQEDIATLINSTIPTATSTLKAKMTEYVTTAQPTNDECFDLTFMIVNPHFTEGAGGTTVPTGWTLESGSITEHRLLTHNFEAYHMPFNLSQTIPNLPKGTYKVTLQGFARHDDANVTNKTNLYCGIVNQEIKDIKAEWSTTSYYSSAQTAMGDNNRDTQYQKDGDDVYQPNGMTGAYYWFQEENPATNQPFYTNEVQTVVSAGDLKIGFKCETNTDWVIWDNFHLYYFGSTIEVTIDEEIGASYTEDVYNAIVTLKRTFKSNVWNTLALPFDVTDAEAKAAFGDDVLVAVFTEDSADPANATVNFNKASDATIKANTPVLLKTNKTEISFKFDEKKTIKAGEAKVEGKNFNFVGAYAKTTTIAEGDYFISNDMLYKSQGGTTLKSTRAYIKAKEPGNGIKTLNIFDEEGNATAIDATEIEGLTVGGKIFDLSGREVKTPVRGLYIQNGKKVFIK